ncbi:MAG: AAA family ATPase [Chlorobi bacterium]|nr:AAA family ATPase [Chlorobiota bacterium]
MKCDSCGTENVADARFCNGCGKHLGVVCAQCNHPNTANAHYCNYCGATLQTLIEPAAHLVHHTPERRHMTVMFSDLAGSTELSEQLDPEEMRELLRRYHSICSKWIRHYEGYLAKFLGDGVLAYFGYPHSHEDDARRAVRAGLAIVEEAKRTTITLADHDDLAISVRVGIHTGLVIVGDLDFDDGVETNAVVGRTPNLAARVQTVAQPNSVVITGDTARLVGGYVLHKDIGLHTLKGISKPLPLFQAISESRAQGRLDVAAQAGLSPFVGRETEWQQLQQRWQEAQQGNGTMITIMGEAGIGKSRLLYKLASSVAETGAAEILECRCSQYHQNSAFHPIIELLERSVLQYSDADKPQEKFQKLEAFLLSRGGNWAMKTPLLCSLLSLPVADSYPPLTSSPDRQKQETIQALAALLLQQSATIPVLLTIEDLHWADPSTREFISILAEVVSTTPLCCVLTTRPEESVAAWWDHAWHSAISLSRLGAEETELLVQKLVQRSAIPETIAQEIARRTDGVPLFIEEVTKAVVENVQQHAELQHHGGAATEYVAMIPATLRESLMARLDKMAQGKTVAQVGATIGREFSYQLLRTVSATDQAMLQQGLRELVAAELLFQQGEGETAVYTFKHALIQDAAYDLLLHRSRSEFHQKIAETIQRDYPEIATTQPEVVAQHFTKAGHNMDAAIWWRSAGERALYRSAYLEAVAHLREAERMIAQLPEGEPRWSLDLGVQLLLGPALLMTRGHAARETEEAYLHANQLCGQLNNTHAQFPILYGLWSVYAVRPEYTKSLEFGAQLLQIAEAIGQSDLIILAHLALGYSKFNTGDLVSARHHYLCGNQIHDKTLHRHLAAQVGTDPYAQILFQDAWILAMMGFPDQAEQKFTAALEWATELNHPFTLCFTLLMVCNYHQFVYQPDQTLAVAQQLIAVSTEQGFAVWLIVGQLFAGWARAMQGDSTAPYQMENVLRSPMIQSSTRVYLLSRVVEAYLRFNLFPEAAAVLGEAEQRCEHWGERFWEAELLRLRSKLQLHAAPDDVATAAATIRQGMEVAKSQGALALQLRAAMELAGLLRMQLRHHEAVALVQGVFNQFTEGFGTHDLQQAAQMIQQLTAEMAAQ